MMRFPSFNKKIALCLLLAVASVSAACGKKQDETTAAVSSEESDIPEEAAASREALNDESTEAETFSDEVYEGTVAASEAADDESPYFGIMYATVLEVNGKQGDSKTIYSFKDKSDPDNGWSFTGLEIGDIETELEAGQDVVILFSGDIINDSENVDFMVILPDGKYELKRIEGKTSGNMMSTFTVDTSTGESVLLMKDNCRMDPNVLSGDSGDKVIVYYAAGDEANGNYPVRVFKGYE